jgi:hypothetical protein
MEISAQGENTTIQGDSAQLGAIIEITEEN